MVSLLKSQGMKSCKNRESFCLSILIFTQIIGPPFDMFTDAMFIFSSVRFLNLCKSRTSWSTLIGILWKWASKLTQLAGFVPSDHKFSCEWNLSFFKAVPTKRLLFYLSNPLHIMNSLFSHFCLFQNAVLHKMLSLGFWNFKPIFVRIQFSLIATFFSLVLLISLNWYLHLTESHEFFKFISFNIWG